MKLLTTTLALICTTLAAALPAQVDERQVYLPCSGLYGSAQCCATDVLGVADLDCGGRKYLTYPTNIQCVTIYVYLLIHPSTGYSYQRR